MKTTTILLLFLLVSCVSASPAEKAWGEAQENDSTVVSDEQLEKLHPWRSSVYIAIGGGTPQGMRGELGYNFGSYVSLALSAGIGDSWSRDPGDGTLALLGILRLPTGSPSVTPYLLVCTGGTLAILGPSDTYTLVYAGVSVPIIQALQLRPEFGLDFTSRHISGGRSLFGGTSPEVTQKDTRVGFHVSLELDIARLF